MENYCDIARGTRVVGHFIRWLHWHVAWHIVIKNLSNHDYSVACAEVIEVGFNIEWINAIEPENKHLRGQKGDFLYSNRQ